MLFLGVLLFHTVGQLNDEFIVDFGGKYLKGATFNSVSSRLTLIESRNNSNPEGVIPNSISASVIDCLQNETLYDAVSIGDSAFQKVRKNIYFGIEFFGAIVNRKKSFLKKNHNFFLIDQNVTLTDIPRFWYLQQFFVQYQRVSNSNKVKLIIPGYSTELVYDQFNMANNCTFSDLAIYKDYEIIQKVHSQLAPKDKSILYIDFGAFSTKATLIDSSNRIVSYNFDEECGIEKVAYRLAIQNESLNLPNQSNPVSQRIEAYTIIKNNESFIDEVFEQHLKTLIEKVSLKPYDDVVILGGGCNLPFVSIALKKILPNVRISLSDDYLKVDHLTFFVNGYHLTRASGLKNDFFYHPLYIKYGSEVHELRLDSIQNINLGKILHRTNATKHNETIDNPYDNRIHIITDENHILSGGSKKFKKLIIPELNNKTFESTSNQILILTYTPMSNGSFEKAFEAKLCDSDDPSKCTSPMVLETSDSIYRKAARVDKKVKSVDAAMSILRVFQQSYSKKKNPFSSEL